ncbi:MAG: DJ-1/PfpI family protein [Myxococcota bacterium]|nr:DJ-1/PfpI family protein [Myxococcota bacterium]
MTQPHVLVPLLEGFEEIEAVTIIDVLRRAEIAVTVASDQAGPVRGAQNIDVSADTALADVDPNQYQMIVLPGGMPGSEHLANHPTVQGLLGAIADAGGYTAAICAAPMALAAAGLHQGKTVTCYPGFESYLAGGHHTEDRVAVDGKVITSRGPGTSLEFALTLVSVLRDGDLAEGLAQGLLLLR